jgi:hypothetical protein
MTEIFENIDNIYSEAFVNYKDDVPEEDWQQISAILWRQNFMKFGIAHFNIYYAVLLTAIVGISIYIGTSKHTSNFKPENEKPFIKEPTPSSSSERPIINWDTTKNRKNLKSQTSKQLKIQHPCNVLQKANEVNIRNIDTSDNTYKNNRITNILSNEQKCDSASEISATTIKSSEKKKIQRFTIVIKNPVILKDTVVQYKRK